MRARTWLVLVMLMLFAGVFGFAVKKWNGARGPSIDYPRRIELPSQEYGSIAVRKLTVSNSGDEALRLTSVASDCSCSGLELHDGQQFRRFDQLVVAPGESIELFMRIAVATALLRGGQRITLTIPINGKVVEPVLVSPAEISLPRMSTNGPVYRASCVCRHVRGKSLDVKIDAASPGLSAEIADVGDNPAVRLIHVLCDPQVLAENVDNRDRFIKLRATESGPNGAVHSPVLKVEWIPQGGKQ